MQCFKASDSSSNSSRRGNARRAREAEEMPISEEDIPAAMDAVKKNHKKSIMLPRKSPWELFSSGSAAHADVRSPLGETRHPSQKSNFHLCQVKISTSEKHFVAGKNLNYGAILMVVTESWELPPGTLSKFHLSYLVIGWVRTFKPIFHDICP